METLVAHDAIGRLMLQCARQPGLAHVWENLLGFEGHEFYMKNWPELRGRTFGETLYCFPEAVVCGIRTAGGRVCLNVDDNYIIDEKDEILVIAEDDDSYEVKIMVRHFLQVNASRVLHLPKVVIGSILH